MYSYAQLDGIDLHAVRIGGPGLGNLLFPWARAAVFSYVTGARLIRPTWEQVKIGPLLRRERDLRHYFGLMGKIPDEVNGLEKTKVLMLSRKLIEEQSSNANRGDVVTFQGMKNFFAPLEGFSDYLRRRLESGYRRGFDPAGLNETGNTIGIHVRLGDFQTPMESDLQGYSQAVNKRTPFDWYIRTLQIARKNVGQTTTAMIFSDGSPTELRPLLQEPNVAYFPSKDALFDMIHLSRCRQIICSNSTYSMWAAFLGERPSYWPPGALRHATASLLNNAIETSF